MVLGRRHEGHLTSHPAHAGVVLAHGGRGVGQVSRSGGGAHGAVHGGEARVAERLKEVTHDGAPALGLGGQFAVPRLDAVLLHGDWPVDLQIQTDRYFGRWKK